MAYLLKGTWFPSWALPVCGTWLGPGLPELMTMVSLQTVGSSSRTSKVMLGSTMPEAPGGGGGGICWTVFWGGSGVHWSGNRPSSKPWVLLMLCGLFGGSDTHRFLLMGVLGSGSTFTFVWFPLPETKQKSRITINKNNKTCKTAEIRWNVEKSKLFVSIIGWLSVSICTRTSP